MLGQTLALRLRQRGHAVTLFESASAPGGLASAQQLYGYTWDRFYHVILRSDLHLSNLLGELGLTDHLRWSVTRTGFYTGGRHYSLSNAFEFLRFPPLSLVDKLRLAATILHASRIKDCRPLERIAVTDWLRRWSGSRNLQRIWLPLLKSKLGDNYRIASAAFIWAIIARMYAARRAGLKRELFGYVDGGYDLILRRLRARLEAEGVVVACSDPVVEVTHRVPDAVVRLRGGGWHAFDRVVLTVPAPKVAELCPQLSPAEQQRLRQVVYQGVACASVLLRKPLAGFYVTNITDAWVPFTAVIEMTALTGRERFGGHTLVYLPRYLTADDPFWGRADGEIREEFIAAVRRMYPQLAADDVVAFQVARAREVLAVSTLEYSARALPLVETSLPTLFVVNSAQIAQGTLNVNESVGLAESKARELDALWKAPNRSEPAARVLSARAG
jgi:protoporphyrinogen oxidase